MIYVKQTTLISLFLIVLSCANKNIVSETISTSETVQDAPNILLIIADDLGSDAFPAYNIGKLKPKMPTMEKLAQDGLRFTNFWAYPTCTPTRASIITGKHSFKTGVISVGDELSEKETILPRQLDQSTTNPYVSAVIGKWHLSEDPNHPTRMGVNYYSGLLSGGVKDYNAWRHTENGTTTQETEYITTKFTDLAIDWVDKQEKPWFLWLAYTAPHTPFHLPPTSLHSSDNLANTDEDIKANPQAYYFSMIEALDSEIERFLSSIPEKELENTVIILIGDNGSPNQVVQSYGKRKAKGSIYQGGINVPLIVSGKNVERVGQVEQALVNSTDLFATILELAGTGITDMHDSKSIVPLFSKSSEGHKKYLYSELGNKRKSGYTIRNERYKYIHYDTGSQELYDLESDPYENSNVITDSKYSSIKKELVEEVTRMRSTQ